jgi:RNA polymerase sigma-70 factor, ECF subfamily
MDGNDELYKEASATYGAALQRLARGYEADPERGRDLLQEIHIELWRSLRLFDNRCSLRTWVYRVALDKSEGAVKDKSILSSAEHRFFCQRG